VEEFCGLEVLHERHTLCRHGLLLLLLYEKDKRACCLLCMGSTRGDFVYIVRESTNVAYLSTLYATYRVNIVCYVDGLDIRVAGCGIGAAQFKEPLYVSVRIEVREVRIR
jgi:hypothetical protein